MSTLAAIPPQVLFFYFLAAVSILSALGVAFAPNILYSAFSLLGTLVGLAGFYLLLGADFVGIVQLLVYVGGILVLILFAVLLTNRIGELKITNLSTGLFLGAVAAIALLLLLLRATGGGVFPVTETAAAPTTQRLGDAFLREHLLPFELASLILLVVLVGAMVIARRAAKEESRSVPPDQHDRLA